MPAHYELYLFGPLRLAQGREPMPRLRSRKAIALLAYVAAQEKPLPRAHLADLFWSADAAEHGHANLRWILNHLTSSLPGCLTISRHTVAWGETVAADLQRFTQLLQQNSSASLTAAVDLYQGELLAGFALDGCPEFELWLTTERTRRLQQVSQALSTLSQQQIAQQNYPVALQFTQQWLALTPWAEEAHRQAIYLLALSGQRSAALQQYAICRQMLATELNVEPGAETLALYTQIRADRLPAPKPSPIPDPHQPHLVVEKSPTHIALPHNLPRQLTPLIGRTVELAQIEELLANPTCTWLTLLGPGGIGKTHLALAAAHQLVDVAARFPAAVAEPNRLNFPDGVWFVALAGISTAELLPTTIAQTLGLALLPGDLRLQLRNHLHDRQLLLVLDNFEHLLDGVDWIEWLIQQAPGLKVLVTSRQRLHHQAEWVLDVGGLATPPLTMPAESATYSAVQLFVQSARRAHATFCLTAANAGQISQICRAVDGMPLGIQLAASWVRTLPLPIIVEEIRRNLDFGTLATHGLPDRHHTLRAVIDSSWRRLGAPEQALLARLAIFQGGADWDAATQVAGATPLLVTRLVDQSLLAVDGAGRIVLHELVRQFAAAQLQALNLTAQTGAAHSRYYSAFLAQQVDALITDQTQTVLQRWDGELDNLRAAWQWAIQHCDAAVISQMAQPLNLYYDYRTLLQEGRQCFQQAADALAGAAPTPANEIARGMVLARYGLLLWRYGEMPLAEQVLQESRTMAERHGVLAEAAYARYLLGYYYTGLRPLPEVEEYLHTALALAETSANQKLIVKILYALGLSYLDAGQIAPSITTLQRSLQLARTLGDMRSAAHVLCYLGNGYFAVKDYAQARLCQAEGLTLFQTIGVQWGVAQAQSGLLQVAYAEGNYGEAKRLCEITIPLYEKTGAHPDMLAKMQHMYDTICAAEHIAMVGSISHSS